MTEDPIPSFSAMLRGALDGALAPDAHSFTDMFAETGVMEFPFAPAGGVRRIEGRAALVEYLAHLGTSIKIESMSAPTVHRTASRDTVILEFTGRARGVASGKDYEQSYVSVIALSDGRIVHYRDYWNPLVINEVIQDAQAASASSQGGASNDR